MADKRDDEMKNSNTAPGDEGSQKGGEQPYIREKIVKPKRRSRFLAVAIGGFFGAVLFGLIACVSFVWIYPYISKMHGDDVVETTTAERIILATHSEEQTVEDTTPPETEEPTTEESTEETLPESEGALLPVDKEWIERSIDRRIKDIKVDVRDIENYAREIQKIYQNVEKSLVTIVSQDSVDPVFHTEQGAASGIMFSHLDSVRTIFILTNYEASAIQNPVIRFSGHSEYMPAELRGTDSIMGLAILCVQFDETQQELYNSLNCIELGNTYQIRAGSPVIAVGAPYRTCGTMGYGSVVEMRHDQMAVDTAFRMYYTNINAPEGGTGFLVNMSGQLIGLINSRYKDPVMEGYIAAVATEELTGIMANMANQDDTSYFGIIGQNITQTISQASGMPEGIYVTSVQQDSPAYQAGIMSGDIITMISSKSVTRMNQLKEVLTTQGRHLPGETVKVTVMRLGRDTYVEVPISVTLGARK